MKRSEKSREEHSKRCITSIVKRREKIVSDKKIVHKKVNDTGVTLGQRQQRLDAMAGNDEGRW